MMTMERERRKNMWGRDDDDSNKSMDNADPDSKAPRRTAWDLVW